ncbi:uncharacterized protein LOC143185787 [Calliopsis andreniformis]|uniref:uncharacterized protein LOC143185787 n=1 Tax=Calliopsis andreniformis TaxID=337506 RepID=UPI003FCDD104
MSATFDKDTVKLKVNYNAIRAVEERVIQALQKEEYTLNTVNSYGENLLHISAANGCLNIIKAILKKQDHRIINRKNKFGWTPLMLAIRNRHIETVKFLLKENANVNDSTYLGMSVFGLAAAINKDMFETVYETCPSALLNSVNDDITPLCIAAMKNDKDLFFRLLNLGFDASKSNEYTQIIMKQSAVPEISNLAKKLDIENYWNDTSDNISTPIFVFNSAEIDNDDNNNNLTMDMKTDCRSSKLHLMVKHSELTSHSLISPTLTCTLDEILSTSPNIYFVQNNHDNVNMNTMSSENKQQLVKNKTESSKNDDCMSKLHLQRLQSIRPPDLNIQDVYEDLDTTLSYVPEFSPVRSPNVPPDINDEDVFGENTPTPPRYRTPPRGMILNSGEAKLIVLLRNCGLSHHIPIFLEQEVDIDLFMTLTDNDLIEIGIKDKSERKNILDVIMDYKKLLV